jgi:L-cystine uptake protein TcyP (sodium:dicarboxylate symporter family)
MAATQTYQNHTRFVPLYHFVVLPILLINILVAGYDLVRFPGLPTVWGLVVTIAVFLGVLFGRVFALAAQDRVIRLEERLRLRELLPGELRGRVNDFTAEQLIALRFASDGEVAELASAVLRDNVGQRAAIKKMIRQWRADEQRV